MVDKYLSGFYNSLVPESKLAYPKCGSTELIEVGKTRLMCQGCYEVFEKEGAWKTEPRPLKLKKCPY